MNINTHAVSSKKRRAQSKVVEMILPQDRKSQVVIAAGGTAQVYLLVSTLVHTPNCQFLASA